MWRHSGAWQNKQTILHCSFEEALAIVVGWLLMSLWWSIWKCSLDDPLPLLFSSKVQCCQLFIFNCFNQILWHGLLLNCHYFSISKNGQWLILKEKQVKQPKLATLHEASTFPRFISHFDGKINPLKRSSKSHSTMYLLLVIWGWSRTSLPPSSRSSYGRILTINHF